MKLHSILAAGAGALALAAPTVAGALNAGTAEFTAQTPTGPVLLGPPPQLVAGGAGSQTDPHVSGAVVSYTDRVSASNTTIHYVDLNAPSTNNTVPGGTLDQLSDISNGVIVFQRGSTTSSDKAIYFYDSNNTASVPTELSPSPGARRAGAAIGADTVAYQQFVGSSSAASDVCVSSTLTPSAPATCITADGATMTNRDAAVSPNGNTVAFAKCQLGGSSCDIYVSQRVAGTWSAPIAVASSPSEEILPDTNGAIISYASNASGDFDIYYVSVTGGLAHQVLLPGSNETNPNMAGDLIAFEGTAAAATNADIFIYQVSTNTLFQLTQTPAVNETLNDISINATTGQIWVVWAQLQPSGGGNDVWAATFAIQGSTPSTLALSPAADTNPVGTSHTVAATVTDVHEQPVPDVVVRFSVAGSVTTSGQCTTEAAGQCSFTYTGPQLPGADSISAYADSDNDGVQDIGEPSGEAAKAWILPFSTPGQVSGGGTIADAQGNKIAFGFSAKNGDKGPTGHCNVVDNAADVMVKCLNVTAMVQSGHAVTIFGNATVNGVATTYRIDAVDNAEPGKDRDVFSIQTGSGYSRSGVLTSGNIQVK